ncbi:cupin domain-containing protein [Rhodobacterales bacterium HKCCE2091]|nr:cupin domain-containing protein [Rhodobacterales bacterium HKCCE2091]
MKDMVLGPGSFDWNGTTYRPLLSTAETGGSLSITDSITPAWSGPPRHIHHDADEIFYLIEGDVEFWLEGETFTRGPGSAVFIPRGREHTYRATALASRHLVILTPGGFEGFFAEMAEGQFRIPEDMGEIEQSAARHHLTFTGPPLGV